MSEPSLKNRTPYVVLVIGLLLVGVAAVVGWRVYVGQQVAPPVVAAEPRVVDAGVPEPTYPPMNLTDGDILLKDGATGLSNEPDLAKWLAQPDIIRRLVAAVNQISNGESPHETLGFLIVTGEFSVTGTKSPKKKPKGRKAPAAPIEKIFMSPKSTARYDAVTRAIGSIDAAAAGALYGKIRPFAESVFREIAPPGKKFDDALTKAIDALAAVPITDAPLEVVTQDEGIGYVFFDSNLESLSRAQKHLLRMGPANARVVVAKLKAFRAASNP